MEVGDQTVTTDGNNVIINSDVTYENKTANVELIINTKTTHMRAWLSTLTTPWVRRWSRPV